jgi:YHS domain-containing protein
MNKILATATALSLTMALSACDPPRSPKSGEPKKPAPEQAEATKGKPQTTCPVMGGAINKSIYADHDGKRVYFCCPGCDGTFKADPEKYIKKLEDAGVVLAKAPAESKQDAKDDGDHTGHNHK